MMNSAMAPSRATRRSSSHPNLTAVTGQTNPRVAAPVVNPGSKKRPESGSASGVRGGGKEAKQQYHQFHGQSPPPELSDTGSEGTELSTSEGDDSSWISWFCGLKGNELLCEVDEDYIQDDFNLCGLQGQVPYYDHALDMILDSDSFSGELNGEEHSEIESAAELLYGLIHARYILTSKGLNTMHEKYKRGDFGWCPRVFCAGQPCLPVGIYDIPRNGSVKIFCPKCEDLYLPRCKYQNNMDGAYIGTTFPHLYLMTYPSAKPAKPVQSYVPRVFGFKLHKSSK
uniref:Casein kinase II subunit beta n=1 Tax=Anthurium amnicola TaxID=1678845 RepID=A0A1D1YEH9_9ARAE